MNFKIVSAGWQCAAFMESTLRSVEQQTLTNWHIGIAYDPSTDDGANIIAEWCGRDPAHRSCMINTERKYAFRNQYETLIRLAPEDDDIIVFLDLDGDQLAHRRVLERERAAYENGALVTYGQFMPVPDYNTVAAARPYTEEVVRSNGYREFHRQGGTGFNHLRTMSGLVFDHIPVDMFQWQHTGATRLPDGTLYSWNEGDFYEAGVDYAFMCCALELAGGRYKSFDEVLLVYNNANPLADNRVHPGQADASVHDFFSRPPLLALTGVQVA